MANDSINDLPRLSDDDREALEAGGIAMEGVSAEGQRDEVPRFHDHGSGARIEGLPDPLPCPFCGSSDFGGIVEGGSPDHRTFHVTCDSCGADGSLAASPLEAAERWNSVNRGAAPAAILRTVTAADRGRLEGAHEALLDAEALTTVLERALNDDHQVYYRRQLRAIQQLIESAYLSIDEVGLWTRTTDSTAAAPALPVAGDPAQGTGLSTIICEIDDVILVNVSAARAALEEFIDGQAKPSPALNLILSALRDATDKGYALCGQARELLP